MNNLTKILCKLDENVLYSRSCWDGVQGGQSQQSLVHVSSGEGAFFSRVQSKHNSVDGGWRWFFHKNVVHDNSQSTFHIWFTEKLNNSCGDTLVHSG